MSVDTVQLVAEGGSTEPLKSDSPPLPAKTGPVIVSGRPESGEPAEQPSATNRPATGDSDKRMPASGGSSPRSETESQPIIVDSSDTEASNGRKGTEDVTSGVSGGAEDADGASPSQASGASSRKRKATKANNRQYPLDDQDQVLADFNCPLCHQVLPCQRDFTAHLRGHNEVKPTPDPEDPTGQAKVYNCCLCGKMLSSFSSLDRHMLVHSGERPFSCQFCGQTFTTNGNMHRHQRTHSSKDGIAGNEEDCKALHPSRRTATAARQKLQRDASPQGSDDPSVPRQVTAVNRHVNGGIEAFACPLCKKDGFSNEFLVESHFITVHSGQTLPCSTCSAVFSSYQTYKMHMKTHSQCPIATIEDEPIVSNCIVVPKVPIMSNGFKNIANNSRPSSPLVISIPEPAEYDSLNTTKESVSSSEVGHFAHDLCVKDKDLADVQSILSLTRNFSGMPLDGTPRKPNRRRRRRRFRSRSAPLEQNPASLDLSNSGRTNSTSANSGTEGEADDMIDINDDDINDDMEDLDDADDRYRCKRSRRSSITVDDFDGDVSGGEGFLDDDPVIKEMKQKGEFPCSQCPAVFPNLRALKGHNKEHMGKAPYKCNVGKCAYSSNDKSTLTRHMRRHTGEKPFECRLCNFGFTTKANCERHLKNKHHKVGREEIRSCLIIHETEDTESLISRLQLKGEVMVAAGSTPSVPTIAGSTSSGRNSIEPIEVDGDDIAFRCKVCKLTFMSRFAVIQHGIHNHPEYAKDIEFMAEEIGCNQATNPEMESVMDSIGKKLDDSILNDKEDQSTEDETPLDLSNIRDRSESNEEIHNPMLSIRSSKLALEEVAQKPVDPCAPSENPFMNNSLKIPPSMPPLTPGFPMLFPGLAAAVVSASNGVNLTSPNIQSSPANNMLYSYLAAMPYLLGNQGLIGGLQPGRQDPSKMFTPINPLATGGIQRMPLPPHSSMSLEISSILAAQELAKKQAEFLQQREAAEALQNLRQGKPASVSPVATSRNKEEKEKSLPVKEHKFKTNGDETVIESDEKIDETMFKMVIKNGVLMKKPKQKRYRTERPYSCQSCNAKFTLRSNMERHIKQQHPECWSSKGRGGRRSSASSLIKSGINDSSLPVTSSFPFQALGKGYTNENDNLMTVDDDTDTEKEEDGLLVIDDNNYGKVEANACRGDDLDHADLASVTKLLNTATTHSFQKYFTGNATSSGNATENEDEIKHDEPSKTSDHGDKDITNGDEKRSAYSSAPHKIECPFCSRKFPWTSSLNRHILTHTGQKPFKCKDCQLWFTTKSNRDRHQSRKHNVSLASHFHSRNVADRPFRCDQCTSNFATKESLVRHSLEKHQLNILQNALDPQDIALDTSSIENEDDDENLGIVKVHSYFKCHVCNEDFLHRAQTIAHIEDEHPDVYKENVDVYEKASQIPIDTNNLILQPQTASEVTSSEDMVTRVNCIFCPCQFRSTMELAKHVHSHTRIKKYNCDICRTQLSSRMELNRHKRTKHPNSASSLQTSGAGPTDEEKAAGQVEVMKQPILMNGFMIGNDPQNVSQINNNVDRGLLAKQGSSPKPVSNNNNNISGANTNLVVSKRANLMDKINKLSLLSAAKAEKTKNGEEEIVAKTMDGNSDSGSSISFKMNTPAQMSPVTVD